MTDKDNPISISEPESFLKMFFAEESHPASDKHYRKPSWRVKLGIAAALLITAFLMPYMIYGNTHKESEPSPIRDIIEQGWLLKLEDKDHTDARAIVKSAAEKYPSCSDVRIIRWLTKLDEFVSQESKTYSAQEYPRMEKFLSYWNKNKKDIQRVMNSLDKIRCDLSDKKDCEYDGSVQERIYSHLNLIQHRKMFGASSSDIVIDDLNIRH